MKYLVFVLTVLLMAACSKQEKSEALQTATTITGKVALADGSDMTIEIFAYYDRHQNEEDNLIIKSKADKEGKFELELPAGINYAILHVAAPGYKSFETKYISGDEAPYLEAALYRTAIPKEIDSVSIYVLDGDRQFFNMNKTESNTFVWEGELDSVAVAYQVLFNDNTSQYDNSNQTEWEYDHAGDYLNIIKSDDKKYRIEINPEKYRKYGNILQRVLTKGNWVNSPVNEQYAEIRELLPYENVSNLAPSYYYLVKRGNDAVLQGMTEQQIQAQAKEVMKMLDNYSSIADSLTKSIKSPYLNDYVRLINYELKTVKEENDFQEAISIMNEIQELPFYFFDFPANITFMAEFKNEPDANMELIKKVIDKSKDKRNSTLIEYNLYYTLSRNDMYKNKYKEMMIEGAEKMLKTDNIDGWIKRSAPSLVQSLQIADMEYAPDFTFTDVNGKQHSLSDYKGKWVLVDFWGTWCGPCRGETPFLVETYEEFKNNNFEIISISTDRAVSEVTEYMKEHNMNWVNTIELDGYADGIVEKYGVSSFPTLHLITPDGKFDKSVTEMDLRGNALKQTISNKIKSEAS
jgi:thiol-disulfide isomerase/thioredoxin